MLKTETLRPDHRGAILSCLIGIFLVSLVNRPSEAQRTESSIDKQIQGIVEGRIEADRLAGVAVFVAVKGKPTYCEAFGFADVTTERRLATDTPFQLASLSKQFAATSVMLLVREKKLKLDDPVSKYLDNLPKDWSSITIRQLLAHTSGIRDYAKFPNIREDYQQDTDRGEILERMMRAPLDFTPGSKYSYSNSGYCIVGCLIEKVSGVSYGKFLQQRIFGPLDMETARLEPLQNQDGDRAIGHDLAGGSLRHSTYNSPSWAFAAGGIVASLDDLIKWDAAIDANTLLTKKEQRELWTPQLAGEKPTDYGLGWMLRPAPQGKHFVLHFGNKPGFSVSMVRLVEDRISIGVLSNRTEGSSQQMLEEIGKAVLAQRSHN